MSRREKTTLARTTVESTSAIPKLVMKEQPQQLITFPFKLYEMLEYACDSDFSSSLSWLADGSAFIIRNKDVMMNDLAPMFFKQTLFRSFTRQLNIWGFVRTETTRGGERGGWQHKDFIRGRPDLLKEIERIEVKGKSKSAVKKSSSTQSSYRSARRAAKSVTGVVVVADESSCSSSRSRGDSQASQSSYKDGSAHVHNTGIAAAALQVPVLQDPQGSVFQYFSYVNYEEQTTAVQDSVSSLSSSSVRRCSESDESTTEEVANTVDLQAESMFKYDVGTNTTGSGVAQPAFNNDDLMYLASIFEKDEHPSHDEDLQSILSLDQEKDITVDNL